MAKLVYALNQSLDGYVDHMELGQPRLPIPIPLLSTKLSSDQ
jgi:hypothetical protein